MKDIQILEVRQVRIFATDTLPFASLINQKVAVAFQERFGWAEATSPSPGTIRFDTGRFPTADASTGTVVKAFELSERRIILGVIGDSDAASAAYQGIADFLADKTGQDGWKTPPLVVTQETHSVATFEFDWTALLAPAFVDYATGEVLKGVSSADGVANLVALKLALEVRYSDLRADLSDYGVTLANKTLTIEPRAGTPLSERRFFTSSPTDSATHLSLLKALEYRLTGESTDRRPRTRGRGRQ